MYKIIVFRKFFISHLVIVLFFIIIFNVYCYSEDNTKLCALTFDDGPDAIMTTKVLEKIEKYNIVATFFLIGQLVNDKTKPVIDREIKDGSEFGNHSWEWRSMDNLTPDEIKQSINKTSEAIEKYTHETPLYFRPPNLAVSKTMYDTIDLIFIDGITACDWFGCGTTAQDIVNNVIKEMDDGVIILLHDVQPEPHPTPEALDILIPLLKQQGYEFVTLSELFKRKHIDPYSKKYEMWRYVK